MLARYLGVISPKINTATVRTAVETVVASEGLASSFPNRIVPSAEAVRFTTLLPIKMAVMSLSYFSSAKA